MTTISFDRSRVTFVTPRGIVHTDIRQAEKFAAASGNQNELQEAIQNPDICVRVIDSTRARGLKGPHTAVCQ